MLAEPSYLSCKINRNTDILSRKFTGNSMSGRLRFRHQLARTDQIHDLAEIQILRIL